MQEVSGSIPLSSTIPVLCNSIIRNASGCVLTLARNDCTVTPLRRPQIENAKNRIARLIHSRFCIINKVLTLYPVLRIATMQAQGAIEIMKFHALEFAAFDVIHFEVLSTMTVGREIAAVCEWGMKIRDNGPALYGRCQTSGRWTARAAKLSKSATSAKSSPQTGTTKSTNSADGSPS